MTCSVEAARNTHKAELVVAFGLDVHSASFMAAWRRSDAGALDKAAMRKMKTEEIVRTEKGAALLLERIDAHTPEDARAIVVMEATGTYSLQLACWLRKLRPTLAVAIVDPSRIKKFIGSHGVRNKTDKIDARAIACYGAERRPAGDEPLEQHFRDLRVLVRLRLRILDKLQEAKCQLHSHCAEDVSPAVARLERRTLEGEIRRHEKDRDAVEAELRKVVEGNEALKRDVALLDSVAGVAFLTAVAVLGEFGDLRRFATGRQLTAFAGLNPELRDSGTKQGKARISKRGSTYGRRALYMGATSIVSTNCQLGDFYQRLVNESHKHQMVALIAVMRKMLVTMRAVLIKGEQYDRNYTGGNGPKTPAQGSGKAPDSACGKPGQTLAAA